MKLSNYNIIVLLLFTLLIILIYRRITIEKFEEKKTPILAIHSVFILPENFVFLEEWITYHMELGFSQFYLYDNYGSIGRDGSSLNKTRAGIEFLKLFNYDIYKEFDKLKHKYPQIHYIKWQPKDENGDITYKPGNAIAHYRDNYSKFSDWSVFIDPDEFIVLDDTNSTNLIDFLKKKEHEGYSKIVMQQKKFQDRFCKIQENIFDIDDIVININVDGWAYKCLYKNSALHPTEDDFFMHDIKMNSGNTYVCDLKELRFNHYNVNNTQINWMKGFLNKDSFEHGKDESMKKFNYLLKKYKIPNHIYNIKYLNTLKPNLCYSF